MLDPRKRALEALALGGAVPSTEEVDVQSVPSVLPPTEYPTADIDGKPRPVPQALTTGDPQGATERDYYADALSEKHRRQFEQSITRIGSGILQAFTGVGPSPEMLRQRQEYADEPLVTYLQKQKEADAARAAELQQTRLAPKPGQRQKSTDPTSPESKRAQMLVKATLGDKFSDEEIAQITEADADNALKYGSLSGQREVSREGQLAAQQRSQADREQRAQQFAQRMGFDWSKMQQDERLALMRLTEAQEAREAAVGERTARTARELGERNVGGFEIDPQNPPSVEASKKMAETKIAYDRVKEQIQRLDGMLKAHGSEMLGDAAGEMGVVWSDLTTGLRLFDQMGVPNANDYVVLAKSVTDPTSMEGAKTTTSRMRAQLREVQRKMDLALRSTANAYKFRPAGATPQPTRAPAANVLPKDSTGQPTLDAPKPAKVQYSPSRDMTRELDSAGNIIREYKGRPNG